MGTDWKPVPGTSYPGNGMNRPTLIVGGSASEAFAGEPQKGGRLQLYESFFGLRERPFDLVPNPRFLFLTDVQREVLSTLRYGLTGPGGITLLIGEAGTGKTTLVQTALSSIGDERVQCVLLSNPTLTRDEFYESLVAGFGLGPEARGSKAAFLSALRGHASARQQQDQVTALMLDEAQSLPDELLEEVRLLSNVETTTTKLLNVVLAGQPELASRLNQRGLRQLKQRVGLRCALRPFEMAETASYLAGRLRIAGGSPGEILTREAVAAIFEASGGIPRVINVVAENALIGGFAAQVRPVPRAIVEEVVADFDLDAVNPTERAVKFDPAHAGGDGRLAPIPADLERSGAHTSPVRERVGDESGGGIPGVKKRFSFF